MVHETITRRPIHYVMEADIKGFFDNVSHEWMLRCLEVRIQDPSLLLLIRRFLKAGYLEEGQLHPSEQGTPQGGNLSPVLANVFLHYVLDLWFAKKYRPQARGDCPLVRYADDFLCLVQDEQDAQDLAPALRGGRLAGPGDANPSSTAASLPRKHKGRLGANARMGPNVRREKLSANRREPQETLHRNQGLDKPRSTAEDVIVSPTIESLGRPWDPSNSR